MKKVPLYRIFCFSAMAALLSGCSEKDDLRDGVPQADVQIRLQVSSASLSRAAGSETEIRRLDVFAFPSDEEGRVENSAQTACHKRSDNVTSPTVDLGQAADFAEGQRYLVYAVANYQGGEALDGETTWGDLAGLIDRNTEADGEGFYSGRPFLMDGKSTEPGETVTETPRTYILNGEGAVQEAIPVYLKRAAAKVKLQITLGGNLPAIYGGSPEAKLMFYAPTSFVMDGSYSGINQSQIELTYMNSYLPLTGAGKGWGGTFYSYENSWEGEEQSDKETYLLLHLSFAGEGEPEESQTVDSYYALYFNKVDGEINSRLERNTCYTMTVSINALGSSTAEEPMPVEGTFTKAPWIDETIEVGGEDSQVHFLVVNSNAVEFADMTEYGDIEFTSSSPLTCAEVVTNPAGDSEYEPYYYNKYNVRISISSDYLPEVTDYTKDKLTGTLTVESLWPEDDGKNALAFATKYFQVKLVNQDGDVQYVNVVHRPLVYVSSHAGWYSTYLGDNGESYYWDYLWGPSNGVAWQDDVDWHVYKYPGSIIMSSNSYNVSENGELGKYNGAIGVYSANGNNWKIGKSELGESSNPRSYHIKVSKSSGNYVVGIPPRDPVTGFVSSAEDVANMVSPSFLIASQLQHVATLGGLIDSPKRDEANDICKKYVEVTDYQVGLEYPGNLDEEKMTKVKRYENWRLPTMAEMQLIAKIQGGYDTEQKNGVTDAILASSDRWLTASWNIVFKKGDFGTPTEQQKGGLFRCVRDVVYGEDTNPLPW